MAHMTTDKYLNKDNILIYLNDFAIYMRNRFGLVDVHILIVGGSALALKGGYRNTTVDIDGYIKFGGNVKDAIDYVAVKNGIYSDWLN